MGAANYSFGVKQTSFTGENIHRFWQNNVLFCFLNSEETNGLFALAGGAWRPYNPAFLKN